MSSKKCLIGDVVVDVSLPNNESEIKMRLGGVSHSARAFWGLDAGCDLKYISPSYLIDDISIFFKELDFDKIEQIGVVSGAPYVFLIGSVKETDNQLYEFLLRENISIEYINENFCDLNDYEDILLIAGNYNYDVILNKLTTPNVHIDLSNNIKDFSEIPNFKFETIFISTSSNLFLKNYKNSFKDFYYLFKDKCEVLILKENRGGSRIHDFRENRDINIPSITQPVVHSVGVGDVYDACYVSKYKQLGIEKAGYLSSWVASEYATTTFPNDFKVNVKRLLKTKIEDVVSLGGCFLPWEKRKEHSIYIAAPDFDYIDTQEIDKLVSALEYHNFYPRRPIKENGQLTKDSSRAVRALMYVNDIKLIESCKLLIAVYINDDTGTMIELGYAKALGIPCLVYDPYNKAYNNMLRETPELISEDLDVIISEVFNIISKLYE